MIEMEDERLESFILIFRHRGTLESWRSNILSLPQAFHAGQGLEMNEFGGATQPLPRGVSATAEKVLSGNTGMTFNSDSSSVGPDSLLAGSMRSH